MDQDTLPPRQVILWRSRADGVIRVRSAQGRFREHHEIPLLTPDIIEGQPTEAEMHPGEMVIGRQTQSAPTEVEDLPILETCPYCFQIIPEEDGITPKQPSPHFNFNWAPGEAQEGVHQERNAVNSQKESWDLTSDPARSRKPTQMLLTQPYFRMLERSILSETREASIDTAGPSAINTPSRCSSPCEPEETPAQMETTSADTGTEGYYARYMRSCNVHRGDEHLRAFLPDFSWRINDSAWELKARCIFVDMYSTGTSCHIMLSRRSQWASQRDILRRCSERSGSSKGCDIKTSFPTNIYG